MVVFYVGCINLSSSREKSTIAVGDEIVFLNLAVGCLSTQITQRKVVLPVTIDLFVPASCCCWRAMDGIAQVGVCDGRKRVAKKSLSKLFTVTI
jgi:hypothetical protein